MKFYNREEEIDYFIKTLQMEPIAIKFVFGPKGSGKSVLLHEVIKRLETAKKYFLFDKFRIYHFDFREKVFSDFNDVLDFIFEDFQGDNEEIEKEYRAEIGIGTNVIIQTGFKASENIKKRIRERNINPFRLMEIEMLKLRKKNIMPVIIIDELQALKGIYINGNKERHLIDNLMNFFVALTKQNHLAHVLCLTSSALFIDELWNNSKLEHTSKFVLIDYVDYDTVEKILKEHDFSDEDIKYCWESFGGNLFMVGSGIEEKEAGRDFKKEVEMFLTKKYSQLIDVIDKTDNEAEKVVLSVLERLNKEKSFILGAKEYPYRIIDYLNRNEIIFYNPINREIKLQDKGMELAVKKYFDK